MKSIQIIFLALCLLHISAGTNAFDEESLDPVLQVYNNGFVRPIQDDEIQSRLFWGSFWKHKATTSIQKLKEALDRLAEQIRELTGFLKPGRKATTLAPTTATEASTTSTTWSGKDEDLVRDELPQSSEKPEEPKKDQGPEMVEEPMQPEMPKELVKKAQDEQPKEPQKQKVPEETSEIPEPTEEPKYTEEPIQEENPEQ